MIVAAEVSAWYGIIPGLAGVAVAAFATYNARQRDILAQQAAAETAKAKAKAEEQLAEQGRRTQDLALLNSGIDFLTTALGDAREELAEVKQELRECERADRAKDRTMERYERLLRLNGITYD